MKKIYALFMLLVACVTGAFAQGSPIGYSKSANAVNVADLRAGDHIVIESRGITNGSRYAAGATAWVAAAADGTLPLTAAFELVATDGKYALKQISSSQYLANPSGASSSVTLTTDLNAAAKVNLVQITGLGSGATQTSPQSDYINGTTLTQLIRFTNANPTTHLNCQALDAVPGWRGGTGAWSAFYVYKASPVYGVSLLVQHKYNGEVKKTEQLLVNAEATVSTVVRPLAIGGVTGTVANGNVLAKNVGTQPVEVNYTLSNDFPFQFTPAGTADDAAKWYTMQVRGYYVKFNGQNTVERAFPLSTDPNLDDPYQFKFVGDPFGFKVYNKQAGAVALGNSGLLLDDAFFHVANAANEREFVLHKNNDWALLVKGTTNNFVNCRPSGNQNYMSTWNSTRAGNENGRVEVGSRIVFSEADPSVFFNRLLKPAKDAALAELEAMKLNTVLFPDAGAIDQDIATIQALSARNNQELEAHRATIASIVATRKLTIADDTKIFLTQKERQSAGTKTALTVTLAGFLTHNTTASEAEKVWVLKKKTNGFVLQNAVTTTNAQITTRNDQAIGTNNTEQVFMPKFFAANHVVFEAVNNRNESYPVLHASGANADIVIWEASNNASQWVVTSAAHVDQATLLAAAQARLATAKATVPLGTGFGQYAVNDAGVDLSAADNSTDLTIINNAVLAYVNKTAFTLNLPKPGQFVRIKTTNATSGNKYFSSDLVAHTAVASTNVLGLTTTADASTIFYVNAAGQLVAFKDGKSVVTTDVLAHLTTADYGVAPAALIIEASSDSKYRIRLDNRTFYAVSTAAHVDASNGVHSGRGYNFDLEEVRELPLTAPALAADDNKYYGTFFTPVAGNIVGDGVEVYYGKPNAEGTRIELTAVDSKEVAANTAVIVAVTNANTAIRFNIANNNASLPNGVNALVGYTTSVNAGAENDFALSAAQGKFIKLGTAKKRAFRAFIENFAAPAGVQELGFNTGKLTAIEAVSTAKTDATIYDLNGRRVAKTQKGGIYLQNGKKFIQL